MLHLPSQLGCICNAVASAVKLGPVNSGRPLYSAPVVSYVFAAVPLADGGTPGGAVTDTPNGEAVPDIGGGLAGGGQAAMSRKTPLSADVGNSAGY